ncbi:hypothetical protein [Komagataeibacter oboediens]|uniref:hypothetical protein n=1 Tax=Komagataeibacter oboediens TaxID=65958 RepID=UPI0012F524D4|nr:hypothetical protein [Komagataeibacter oboediens]
MTENQPNAAHSFGPVNRAQERVEHIKKQADANRADLDRAKVALLNEMLREVEMLRRDPDCPPTALIMSPGGPFYVRMSRLASQSMQTDNLCITDQTEGNESCA